MKTWTEDIDVQRDFAAEQEAYDQNLMYEAQRDRFEEMSYETWMGGEGFYV